MISGLNKHENSLGVMHVTTSVLQGSLDTAKAKEQAYQTSRNARKTAFDSQKSAKAGAQSFALNARKTLAQYLGQNWSVAWTQAGFKNNSLVIPDSLPELVELLGSLETYFTDHPVQQNAALSMTAVVAGQQRVALEAAIAAVSDSTTDQRTARDDRDAAEDELVGKTRALQSELDAILKPTDQRWLDFIEDVPADEQRPEAVDEVELDNSTPRHVKGSWDAPVRAERFLIRIKVAGKDADFRHVQTVQEPQFDFNTFEAGAHVQVQVVAANSAGESAPSPVAEVAVS